VPTPTPLVPEIVAQGTGVRVCSECGEWIYFSLRTAGIVTITVDYTFPDTNPAIWVAPGHCTYEMAVATQCSWVVKSFINEKPGKIVQSLSAGEQTLVIDNPGTHEETVSYQVVLNARSSTAQAHGAANTSAAVTRLAPHRPSAETNAP
jgi:hypothetical protein